MCVKLPVRIVLEKQYSELTTEGFVKRLELSAVVCLTPTSGTGTSGTSLVEPLGEIPDD